MRRAIWLRVLGAACATAFPLAAQAASDTGRPPLAEAPSAWAFDGGLYAWALWVQGDATTRGLTFDIYADPVDLIEALDGPIIMANFEAKRDRFALYADVVYAKFHNNADFLSETKPIPALTLKGNGRIGADLEFGVYQADGFYEVARFTGAQGNKTTFEFGGGARYVREELNVTAAIDLGVSVNLNKQLNRLENRIKRIQNREDRVQSLAQLNALRKELVDKRVIRAGDKGLNRRVSRLERRLKKVDNRGEAIAAINQLEKFRLDLLNARIGLDSRDFTKDLAFADSGVVEWVDPVIAMRMTHAFGDGQSFTAMGDIGGFNADSDLSWQVLLTYDYEGTFLGYETTTSLGYKALGLHYEESTSKGRRGIDAILHGPIAELSFRW